MILGVGFVIPPKRKSKHVLPITSTTPRSFSNGSPSPCQQGEHSNQLHIPISTPSTAQSGINRTTQSSVDSTDFVDTAEQESSNGSLHKRKRGISPGLASQRIMDASKIKLVVQAREGHMCTFGETSSPFANESGIIMRNVVSQCLTGWSQATPHDRELA
ncbi:Hypothetical predicted protein [Olea europaea subsp. europaea]|uniref:Uncharacterized protein n=1 Tax=Olea europaea subsp. europaea TaxID=158383 RepID=A0A8S0PR30_OLEEU|nr:Hypothetical predicted protein [Olea europaea subsp. europaea]